MSYDLTDKRCSRCNTHLRAIPMDIGCVDFLCPFCELHEYDVPMQGEELTSELRSDLLDLVIKHTDGLNELLDYDSFKELYVPSFRAEVEGLSIEDDWLNAISEKTRLIDALASRIIEGD